MIMIHHDTSTAAQAATPVTQPQRSGRRWMDGCKKDSQNKPLRSGVPLHSAKIRVLYSWDVSTYNRMNLSELSSPETLR